jgi:hypothetical protein
MIKLLLVTIIGLTTCSCASSELKALRFDRDLLKERVEQLEQSNSALSAETQEKNAPKELTLDDLDFGDGRPDESTCQSPDAYYYCIEFSPERPDTCRRYDWKLFKKTAREMNCEWAWR